MKYIFRALCWKKINFFDKKGQNFQKYEINQEKWETVSKYVYLDGFAKLLKTFVQHNLFIY